MAVRRDSPISEERTRVGQAVVVQTPTEQVLDDVMPSAPFEFGLLDILPLPRAVSRAVFGEPERPRPQVGVPEVRAERPGLG